MMTYLFLAVLALLSPLVSADRCPTFANYKTSCTSTTCGHFVFKGRFNEELSKKSVVLGKESGVSLEVASATPAACCNECRLTESCAYWNFFASTGLCTLHTADLCASSRSEEALESEGNDVYEPSEAHSYVGGVCHAPAVVVDAVGVASATASPIPEKAFCLVADKDLHINMLLSGYVDGRNLGAAGKNGGQPVRTWIRDIGVMWTAANGKTHSLRLKSRRGSKQERGDGYMESIEVDGTGVPQLTLGDELNLFDGEASVSFEAYEKTGPYDIDVYRLKIGSLLEAEVRLRIAHPLLQLDGDAEVHMNMDILEMKYSPVVHGVLGQTYRDDRLDQALNYAALSELMVVSRDDAAKTTIDSLDGTADSYVVSSVLATDCAYTQFHVAVESDLSGRPQQPAEVVEEEGLEAIAESVMEGAVSA